MTGNGRHSRCGEFGLFLVVWNSRVPMEWRLVFRGTSWVPSRVKDPTFGSQRECGISLEKPQQKRTSRGMGESLVFLLLQQRKLGVALEDCVETSWTTSVYSLRKVQVLRVAREPLGFLSRRYRS